MKKFLRYVVLTVIRFGAAILLLMAYTGNLGEYGWTIAIGAVLAATLLVTFIPPVERDQVSTDSPAVQGSTTPAQDDVASSDASLSSDAASQAN